MHYYPRLTLLYPTTESPAAAAWKASFKKQGYYDWKVTVAKKRVTVKIFPEDLENTTKWDTSIVWDQFPQNIDVLTLHGLADSTVPPCVVVTIFYHTILLTSNVEIVTTR
ncbi:hypothetical protein C0992_003469 [Termitomyces sp. T32_za158]|nr:hypothetical protein C0992_003469 [Termitomyces sp. T32_za158]